MPYKNPDKQKEYLRKYRLKNKKTLRVKNRVRAKEARKENRWNKAISAVDAGRIEMIDGESINDRYVLLGTANHGHVYNPKGLATVECLKFLTELGKTTKGYQKSDSFKIFAFAFDYDTNMILKDLSRKKIMRLTFYGSVLYQNYRIEYWQRKRLEITRYTDESCQVIEKSVVIDDVFSLFGCSFMKALDQYKIPITPEDKQKLNEGKAERATFAQSDIEKIIEYNRLECVYGIELVKKLVSCMREAGFRTNDLYSPACFATEIFRNHDIKRCLDVELSYDSKSKLKQEISRASYRAYFGGRIECVKYGKHFGKITSLDINSAYPSAMLQLPNLQNGKWKYNRNKLHKHPFTLYHIRWDFPEGEALYPFPWRTNNGQILYPKSGEGWYWQPEVMAAIVYSGHYEDIEIIESYSFIENDSTDRPFSFVKQLYEKRLRFKREKNQAELPLKLAYNSAYGKLAQGDSAFKGKKPTYHQIEWAGYITSVTRATIYQTVMNNGLQDNLIAIATDGIYLTDIGNKKLNITTGDELGQWKQTFYSGIEMVQSGVYRLFGESDYINRDEIEIEPGRKMIIEDAWFIKNAEGKFIEGIAPEIETIFNDSNGIIRNYWTFYGRGYMSKAVDWKTIEDGWKHGKETVEFACKDQFISLKYAAHTNWKNKCLWKPKKKKMLICSGFTKRLDIIKPSKWTESDNPSLKLFPTQANSLFVSKWDMSAKNEPKYAKKRDFDRYSNSHMVAEEDMIDEETNDESFFTV